MSLKLFSAEVTNRYLYGIMLSVRLDEMGPDAKVNDINLVSMLRAEVSIMDEGIRKRLAYNRSTNRAGFDQDPDADCP